MGQITIWRGGRREGRSYQFLVNLLGTTLRSICDYPTIFPFYLSYDILSKSFSNL